MLKTLDKHGFIRNKGIYDCDKMNFLETSKITYLNNNGGNN